MKTNACRILDELGVEYTLVEYNGDPTTMAPGEFAARVGQVVDTLFKTLVVIGDRSGHTIAVVPLGRTIDLKALARVTKDKRVALAPIPKLAALTGYVRGGVTALGTKRPMSVTLDASALEHERIGVSAGKKGVELLLSPGDYVRATGARVERIAAPCSSSR